MNHARYCEKCMKDFRNTMERISLHSLLNRGDPELVGDGGW